MHVRYTQEFIIYISELLIHMGDIMRIITIIGNDLKILSKNKISLICLILIPPLLIIMFSKIMAPLFGINSFVKTFSIIVVDNDDSLGSRMAISSLDSEDYISKLVKVEKMSMDEGIKHLEGEEAAALIVVPQGFSSSIYVGENKPLKVLFDSKKGVSAELTKSFFESAGELVAAGQSGIYTVYHFLMQTGIGHDNALQRTQKAMEDLTFASMGRNEIFKQEVVADTPPINPIQYYFVGIGVMFIMFSVMIGVRIITQDYENGLISRIQISSVKDFEYMFSKLISIIVIGILECISIFTPIILIFKDEFFQINLSVLIVVFALIFGTAGLCATITVLSKRSSVSVLISIIVIFIFSLIGGCIFPITLMSDWLKLVSQFSVSNWAIKGITLAMTGGDVSLISNTIVLIMLFGVGSFLLAIVAYRALPKL